MTSDVIESHASRQRMTDERLGEYGARLDALERGQVEARAELRDIRGMLQRIESGMNRAPAAAPAGDSSTTLALHHLATAVERLNAPQPQHVSETRQMFEQVLVAVGPKRSQAMTNMLASVGLIALGGGFFWALHFLRLIGG